MEHPQPIQDFINANMRTTTTLILTPHDGEPDLSSLPAAGSRIGGPAWVSQAWPWPADPDGTPMLHLAQLNFAELPSRDGYPSEGLLQFFLGDNENYGIRWENYPDALNSPYHRLVRYIPAADLADGHAEGDLNTQTESISHGFFTVSGTVVEQAPTWVDGEAIALAEQQGIDWEDYYFEEVEDEDKSPQNFFGGGWAFFTQDDPRTEPGNHRLLLQIDSNADDGSKTSVIWGDMGVANFFIAPDDLAALNFDNVIYTWDCY